MKYLFHKYLIDICLLILLISLVIVIPLNFTFKEHTFYAWDFRGYQLSSINQAHNFIESPVSILRVAINSLGDDYNALYTVPIAPLMILFGAYESRWAYILSLSLTYLFAYAIILGLIFANMVRYRKRLAFWVGAFIPVLLPAVWLPTLRGYPDTGGALAIALAILVYLKEPRIKYWWQILIIGVSLSLAILFRRHFGYGTTAFLITIIFMVLLRFLMNLNKNRAAAVQWFVSDAVRIGLTGLVAILVLLAFGYPFVVHVFSQNFLKLYSSFETSLANLFGFYRSYYGWLAIILAIIGFALCAYKKLLKTEAAIFITMLTLVSIFQWVIIVRQINPHYTLHFSFFILLGISAIVWVILFSLRDDGRAIGLLLIVVFILANMVNWFGVPGLPRNRILQALFPQGVRPLIRADYQEISNLVTFMRSKSGHGKTFYIVDSSGVINNDLLSSADQALFPKKSRLNILPSPQVDSRDYYPLEALLDADFVVVSSPLQRHLPIEEQGVVSSVYDLLINQEEMADDFKKLPINYHLNNGVETSIYAREQATDLDVSIRALKKMQAIVGSRPGNQADWMRLNSFAATSIKPAGTGYQLNSSFTPGTELQTLSYLYLGEIPATGLVRGNLKLSPDCPNAQLKLLFANGDGRTSQIANETFSPGEQNILSEGFSSPGWPYLIIDVSIEGKLPGNSTCQVEINSLSIETGQ